MKIDSLLKGKTVLEFSIGEQSVCFMSLSDQYALSIECLCRFVGKDGMFLTSQDHGHQFGLPAPFDASTAMSDFIKGKTIVNVDCKKDTGDLILFFDTGRFEIICNSAGYEAYQLRGPDNLIMVGRGGRE